MGAQADKFYGGFLMKIKKEKPSQEFLRKLDVDSWSIWECEPSSFDWQYSEEELAYVLEGKVTVETAEGSMDIEKGDFVTFPKGLKCTWEVKQKIRKRYSFR